MGNTNFLTPEAGRQTRLTGEAAEHMVMAEILLRGFNVAQYVVDNGVDLVVENGARLQVKSSRKRPIKNRGYKYQMYNFQTRWKKDRKQSTGQWRVKNYDFENVDFVIFVCLDDKKYLIVPSDEVPKWGITLYESMLDPSREVNPNDKYTKYIDKWDYIKNFRED